MDIINFYNEHKETIYEKKVCQILNFFGDGKLKDEGDTSKELRDFLKMIKSELLITYIDECLNDKFTDSGLVLQDIVNEIGNRLGFNVINGRYRGTRNDIGFDGLWESSDGFNMIVEVKTTDAFRIKLDTIATYRKDLILSNKIQDNKSSIIIVVGRNDTGGLEAEVRGSRHAWDVRLISIDSLIKLLNLKETFNDSKTFNQINSILRPIEYTKVDQLIELISTTADDLENESIQISEFVCDEESNYDVQNEKLKPEELRNICIKNIEISKGVNLKKETRICQYDEYKSFGVAIAVSKVYSQGSWDAKYWFAFHPHYGDFLDKYKKAYVSYGCSNPNVVFLIPYSVIKENLKYMWTTEKKDKVYYHIYIFKKEREYFLQLPNNENEGYLNISGYII